MGIATLAAGRRFGWATGCTFLLMLSGCSHTITTPMADLAPLAPDAPTIRVERAAVTDYGSVPAHTYASFDVDLHNSLHADGKPQISGKSSAPLVLSEVNITSQTPRTHGFLDFWVAYFSFFFPPLSFIPMPAEIDYSVDYTLDDTAGREVMRGHITDTVRGKLKGWYVGRIDATANLLKAAGEFAAENSARLVLNDLRRNNIQLVAAADHYRTNPKLRGAELAAARERKSERARKRSEMARHSSQLMAAKQRSLPSARLAGGLFGSAMPVAVPAAAFVQARTEMPVAVLLRPKVVGPTAEMQEQILHNTMRSVLSETHSVVSEAELDEARVAAATELGHEGCDQPACARLVLESLNADHRFMLRILREPTGAQLVVGVEDGGQTLSRSSYCDGCTTGGLDEQVTELTAELAKQVAPVPASPAMAAVPAMAPAPMATGFANSPGNTVVGAVADVAKQCVAKTVAMQACSLVPGFGKLACRAIAQAKFSGLPCP